MRVSKGNGNFIMNTGTVRIYYGDGQGKTAAALGCAIYKICKWGSVIIIQFLKKKDPEEIEFFRCLEPKLKVFHFQKSNQCFEELDGPERKEVEMSMKNGLSYARKVLLTGECSTLVLDEVLGLVDYGIATEEEIIRILDLRSEDTDIILTGRVLGSGLLEYADAAYEVCTRKNDLPQADT